MPLYYENIKKSSPAGQREWWQVAEQGLTALVPVPVLLLRKGFSLLVLLIGPSSQRIRGPPQISDSRTRTYTLASFAHTTFTSLSPLYLH